MKRLAGAAVAAGITMGGLLARIPGAAAGSASQAAALPTINVVMTGKSITVSGQTVSGAVNVVSTTTGEREGDPAFLRLNPGVTFDQAANAVDSHRGNLDYLRDYGSLVFDASVPKGTRSAETVLEPGHYVALDTAAGQNSNVPATQLPHTEFDVTQSSTPAPLPAPQATIRAIEFGFGGPVKLHSQEFVRFENDGFLVHMIAYVKARNKAGAQKVAALLRSGKDNRAQKFATGFGTFAGPLSTGGLQQFNIRTGAGWYVLACFMDTQDGREHTRLGMVRLLHIVR